MDEYTAFSGVSGKSLAMMERELLAKSEMVLVSSNGSSESKHRYNPNCDSPPRRRLVALSHRADPGTQNRMSSAAFPDR